MIYGSCLSPERASRLRHHSPWPVTVLRLHPARGAGAAGLGMSRAVPFPRPHPPGPGGSWCEGVRPTAGRAGRLAGLRVLSASQPSSEPQAWGWGREGGVRAASSPPLGSGDRGPSPVPVRPERPRDECSRQSGPLSTTSVSAHPGQLFLAERKPGGPQRSVPRCLSAGLCAWH